MNKKYMTFRETWLQNDSKFTPSFFNDKQFADYVSAWLTKIDDCIIWEDRYTWELIPWIKSLRRFWVLMYNPDYINWEEFANNIKSVGYNFAIELLTAQEAIAWLKANTNLTWKSENEVILQEKIDNEFMPIEERTLVID